MITFFATILFMSVFCCSIYLLMQREQPLHFLRRSILNQVNQEKERHEEQIKKIKAEFATDKVKHINKGETDIIKQKRAILKETEAHLNDYHKERMRWFNVYKPLVLCVWCFASFWGTIAFVLSHLFFWHSDFSNWKLYPVWAVSIIFCSLFNAIISAIMQKLNIIE